ncbi:MAG: type VI secretion system baseplate subunit TssG [Pseudomonadota bacterium]
MSNSIRHDWVSQMNTNRDQYAPLHFIRQLETQLMAIGDDKLKTLRFTVNPSLSFPTHEINSLSYDQQQKRFLCQINFMGLIGVTGILPAHYLELALDKKNTTELKAFLDIFHHRSIMFFYQAWKKHQLVIDYESTLAQTTNSSPIRDILNALLGEQCPSGNEKLPYLATLANRNKSLSNLQALLSRVLKRATVITPFRYATETLDPSQTTYLTTKPNPMKLGSHLGTSMTLGKIIRMDHAHFTVSITAKHYNDFKALTRDNTIKSHIHDLCAYFVGYTLEFSINITLAKTYQPSTHLHASNSLGHQLGIDSWLHTS